jgi:hypothetical protein
MAGLSRNSLIGTGAILAIAGALAIAVPVFTTQENTEIVKIGDLKLTATEQTSHTIPWFLALGALLTGVAVIGAGFARAMPKTKS